MFLLNNKSIGLDTAFTAEDGTQYPANWIRLASPEERAAIGITEVADAASYDDRFYWSVGNPKDLAQCKEMMISQVKATAGSMLASTDWKVIRASEGIKPVDADTLAARSAIRTASNDNEAAINACESVDQLVALQMAWPSDK